MDNIKFFDGKKLLTDKLGQYVIDTYFLIHIENIDSFLYAYNKSHGVYSPLKSQRMLHHILYKYEPSLSASKIRDVINYIQANAPIKQKTIHNIIAFKGTLLDIDTLENIEPSHSTVVTTDMTHVAYDSTATDSPILDTFMCTLFGDDTDKHKLIYEIIGYGLANNNFMGKFFIFYGKGGDGKSTLLNLIKKLYGDNNVSSISLSDIQARFSLANIHGKMLNIGDDIGKGVVLETDTLKKVVTGETIMLERKGEQPFSYTPRVKLVFASNEVPRIADTSRGMNDRLMVIPFNNRIRATDKANPNIITNLVDSGALPVLLNRAIEGLKRIRETNQFTQCEEVVKLTEEQILNNNNARLFINEVQDGSLTYSDLGVWKEEVPSETIFTIDNNVGEDIYNSYRRWAINSGYRPFSKRTFLESLKDVGYSVKQRRINGKRKKVWVYDK